jgi:hypothetical protein
VAMAYPYRVVRVQGSRPSLSLSGSAKGRRQGTVIHVSRFATNSAILGPDVVGQAPREERVGQDVDQFVCAEVSAEHLSAYSRDRRPGIPTTRRGGPVTARHVGVRSAAVTVPPAGLRKGCPGPFPSLMSTATNVRCSG